MEKHRSVHHLTMWSFRKFRRFGQKLAAFVALPVLVLADAVLALVEAVTPIPRPISAWLALTFVLVALYASLRALYTTEPAAAATTASSVPSDGALSVHNVVFEMHIVIRMEFLSALLACLKAVIAVMCSIGVMLSTAATTMLQYPITFALVFAIANGSNMLFSS